MTKTVSVIFLSGLCFLLSNCDKPKATHPKPNIILIYADDLGYGDVEFLNPESKILTPNINSLAAEGMSFSNAHSAAAVCTPSRYSVLTGRYPWRSEMKKGVSWVWDAPLIKENEYTIGHMLKDHGYSTALIGKWHLGWNWPTKNGLPATLENEGKNVDYDRPVKDGPVSRGFDYYFGDDTPSFPPHAFIENDRLVVKPTEWLEPGNAGVAGAMAPGWKYENLQTALTDKAIEYITKKATNDPEQPFFLFYASSAPHTPIAPREDFEGKTKAGEYGDFLHELDYHIGRITGVLDSLGIAENTMIIFTSDNGPTNQDGTNYVGEIGSLLKYGHNSGGELRGIKSDAWEGGHHVPFIVKWPKHIKPNTTSGALVSQVDLMATWAAILGIKLPDSVGVDSHNMLPVLKAEEENYRKALVTQSGNGILSIQKGDWKLILSSGGGGKWTQPTGNLPAKISKEDTSYWKNIQLYNLNKDLTESENKAAGHPGKVQELMRLLKSYILKGRSTPGKALPLHKDDLWAEVEWVNAVQ